MTRRRVLRARVPAAVCLLASVAMLSCHGGSPLSPRVPDTIRAFVEAEALPRMRGVRVDLNITDQQLTFFHAQYGRPHDCPSGCFYSTAFGVQLGDRIGWIRVNDYESVDSEALTFFSVESGDGPLFREATWEALEQADEWIFWSALLPRLAASENTPIETLRQVAQRLYRFISPYIASLLLANPRIQSNDEVLQVLACLPVFTGDAYGPARSRARELLANRFPGCE